VFEVVNAAAVAYKGVIPADRWHEPYMSRAELESEIADGVVIWVGEEGNRIVGVMGIQDRVEVSLVRHAYTLPAFQGQARTDRHVGRRDLGHRLLSAQRVRARFGPREGRSAPPVLVDPRQASGDLGGLGGRTLGQRASVRGLTRPVRNEDMRWPGRRLQSWAAT
jgi:hypothetical protein